MLLGGGQTHEVKSIHYKKKHLNIDLMNIIQISSIEALILGNAGRLSHTNKDISYDD